MVLDGIELLRTATYSFESFALDFVARELLGRGRAQLGMFEGDLNEGELEIGQISGMIDDILPVSKIINKIVDEFNETSMIMGGLTL